MAEEKAQNDHDLLITLNVRVQDLIDTIKQMDGTLSRDIGGLKEGKLDRAEYTAHCANDKKDFEIQEKEIGLIWTKFDKHEAELNNLTRYLWLGMGALTVVQFIAPFLIAKYLK